MPAAVHRAFARQTIAANPVPGEPTPPRRGLGADLGDSQGRTLVAGEWNSAIFEPLQAHVLPADMHCAKNRMSGMWMAEQPLRKYLTAAGKKTLLFGGVNTDQCVLGTLADAYTAGWDCILVEDCCGTPTPGAREVCLLNASVSCPFILVFISFSYSRYTLGNRLDGGTLGLGEPDPIHGFAEAYGVSLPALKPETC